MKQGWEVKKLVEVCQIRPPKKEAKDRLSDEELVSFVPMENLERLSKNFIAKNERALKEVYKGYTFFREEDVLLAKITPCFENGKLGIARNLKNGIGFGSSEYIVLRTKGEIIPDYLFYFLSKEEFRLNGQKVMTGAVGHKRVPLDFVENTEIPFPKTHLEQQRVVELIDEAFESIEKAKENTEKKLQNARELFESYLQGVFANPPQDWEEKRLGEITSKIGSGATPKGGKASYKEQGISLIRSQNVYDDGFRELNLAFIDEMQAKKLNNVEIFKDDVLLNITGASIARCCVVPEEILPARVNQHVSILRPIVDIIQSSFLQYSLISKPNKEKLLNIARSGGSTREALTKDDLFAFSIFIPQTISEQESIVEKLDTLAEETKKLEEIYIKKLANLDKLKKSILQKAFNGEL
ncbi:restriction endonuclease subunit S [Alkalihalobacillus sp. FSL W8-0930]